MSQTSKWLVFNPTYLYPEEPTLPSASIQASVPTPSSISAPTYPVIPELNSDLGLSYLNLSKPLLNWHSWEFNIPSLIPVSLEEYTKYTKEIPGATAPTPISVDTPDIDFSDIWFTPAIAEAVTYTANISPVTLDFATFPQFKDFFEQVGDEVFNIPEFEELKVNDLNPLSLNIRFNSQAPNFLSLVGEEDALVEQYFNSEWRVFQEKLQGVVNSLSYVFTFESLKTEIAKLLTKEKINHAVYLVSKDAKLQQFSLSCAIYVKRLQARQQYLNLFYQNIKQSMQQVLQLNQDNIQLWKQRLAIDFKNWQNVLKSNKVSTNVLLQTARLNERLFSVARKLLDLSILAAQAEALNIERERLIIEQNIALLKVESAKEREKLTDGQRDVILTEARGNQTKVNNLSILYDSLLKRLEAQQTELAAYLEATMAKQDSLNVQKDVLQLEADSLHSRAKLSLYGPYLDAYSKYLNSFLDIQQEYVRTVSHVKKANIQLAEVCKQAQLELYRPYYYATEYFNTVVRAMVYNTNKTLEAAQDMANATLSSTIIEQLAG